MVACTYPTHPGTPTRAQLLLRCGEDLYACCFACSWPAAAHASEWAWLHHVDPQGVVELPLELLRALVERLEQPPKYPRAAHHDVA